MTPGNRSGMTLVEIMIVVAIIGMLATLAMAAHLRARETSQAVVCARNRASIEQAERRYLFDTGAPSPSIQALEHEGYLKLFELCPAGGDYAWVEEPESSPLYHSTIACSVHGVGEDEAP
jgi:prepilin-type N-terminal cleavage/methylation domain-containing protein